MNGVVPASETQLSKIIYASQDDEGDTGECSDTGWPTSGDGWEDWTDMIAETGCIPETYDYYLLPNPLPPQSGPSTADDTPTWSPGEDLPAIAPDNCDFYDATRDEWIYFYWGCG